MKPNKNDFKKLTAIALKIEKVIVDDDCKDIEKVFDESLPVTLEFKSKFLKKTKVNEKLKQSVLIYNFILKSAVLYFSLTNDEKYPSLRLKFVDIINNHFDSFDNYSLQEFDSKKLIHKELLKLYFQRLTELNDYINAGNLKQKCLLWQKRYPEINFEGYAINDFKKFIEKLDSNIFLDITKNFLLPREDFLPAKLIPRIDNICKGQVSNRYLGLKLQESKEIENSDDNYITILLTEVLKEKNKMDYLDVSKDEMKKLIVFDVLIASCFRLNKNQNLKLYPGLPAQQPLGNKINIKEIANLLGCSRRTCDRRIKDNTHGNKWYFYDETSQGHPIISYSKVILDFNTWLKKNKIKF